MSPLRLALVAFELMTSQAALHIVRPMTSYRLLALGEGSTSIGVVTAAFALAPLFLALPLSRLTTGRRTAVLGALGSSIMVVGALGLALMTTTVQAVVASAVLGAGHIGLMLALQILITQESPDSSYDRNFGIFTAGASVGQLLGPIAGTAVLTAAGDARAGTSTAMLIAAGACLVTAVSSLALIRGGPKADVPGSGTDGLGRGARDVLRHRGATSAIYVGLIVLAGIDILTAYLPVLGEETSIPPLVVGMLLSVRAAASIASRLLIGRLVAWTSRALVLIVSTAVAALVLAALPLMTETALLVVLMMALGLTLGLGQPLTMSWLALLVPQSLRGRALAVRLVGNRLGQVLAPTAAAGVSGVVGSRAVFWMLSLLLATATVVTTVSHRGDPPDEATP